MAMTERDQAFFRKVIEVGKVYVASDVYKALKALPQAELGLWGGIEVVECVWLGSGTAAAADEPIMQMQIDLFATPNQ